MSFVFEDSLHTPVSLNCKLVSVPYLEYKNGILTGLLLQIRTLEPKFVIDKRKVQTKVRPDQLGPPVWVGSTQIVLDHEKIHKIK